MPVLADRLRGARSGQWACRGERVPAGCAM